MKRLILVSFILLLCAAAYAQDRTNENKGGVYYIEIYEYMGRGGTEQSVAVNFGLNGTLLKTFKLVDENQKVLQFENLIGAMNYLGRQGWRAVSYYERHADNGKIFRHCVMEYDTAVHPRYFFIDTIDEQVLAKI